MLTLALLTLFLVLIFWICRKPSYLPPGRWGLPLIGYLPLYTSNISQIIINFRKEYGNIFTWRIGGTVMVFLCDYKLIKETLSRPECQGRPTLYTDKYFSDIDNEGLITAVGYTWVEGRRFAVRHLRDFGMGKSSMEGIIQHEAVSLVKSYERTAGTPVEISWNVNVAVLNVIWKLVADQRYETDDEEIIKFNKTATLIAELFQGPLASLNLIPTLGKILPNFILNKWMKVDLLCDCIATIKMFISGVIQQHVKTLDPNSPRDYIDAYLIEIQKQKDNQDTIFKEDYKNLVHSIFDLFFAGSETTSSTMRWMVALMAQNPEVQKKMQEEIDHVVTSDREPSLDDRERMPYTEAVLLELHRFVSLVPLGIYHSTTEDIQIHGYHLPKDTVLFGCLEICHRSPNHWERPDIFYPEHFLDDQGKLKVKKEGFLPFSLGRRQCLGESLARMELFLFATCLFQKFSIAPPEGVALVAEADESQPLLRFIKTYKVVMTRRQ